MELQLEKQPIFAPIPGVANYNPYQAPTEADFRAYATLGLLPPNVVPSTAPKTLPPSDTDQNVQAAGPVAPAPMYDANHDRRLKDLDQYNNAIRKLKKYVNKVTTGYEIADSLFTMLNRAAHGHINQHHIPAIYELLYGSGGHHPDGTKPTDQKTPKILLRDLRNILLKHKILLIPDDKKAEECRLVRHINWIRQQYENSGGVNDANTDPKEINKDIKDAGPIDGTTLADQLKQVPILGTGMKVTGAVVNYTSSVLFGK